ncbi:MAG: polysaccharide deacetylase family protein [Verrucomicrobiota bacterium]
MMKFTLLASFLASLCLWAQDAERPELAAVADPVRPDDGARVAVLGYHDLAEKQPETAMRIHTSKFRKQMETLRQLGITVISWADFVAWKNGSGTIPEKSLLLTFDDGWKSVYTDALPILRELHYPFTLYLYKNYVDGGGKALTTPMIREMIAAGATIGSHSVSHPYPQGVKKVRKQGPEALDAFLRFEMGESKHFLESSFAVPVTSYAYPGGYVTEEMHPLAKELGYTHCVTVVPGKVTRGTPDATLPRYMIFGNNDKIFEVATSFRDAVASAAATTGAAGLPQATPYPVVPEPGAVINSRLPVITADLSKVASLDPASLVMRVSGFGEVPAKFTPETHQLSWRVNRRLRQPSCQVAIHWKDAAGKATDNPLRWAFQIDREAAYLPDGE